MYECNGIEERETVYAFNAKIKNNATIKHEKQPNIR